MLPEDNNLPDRCYDAKKILCPVSLEYTKTHACPNDCILYRKEYENLDQCLECGVSRYKLKDNNSDDNDNGNVSRKRPPAKMLWYLPIISRFKNIRWRVDERKCDGNIRHVADSLQWKKIDSLFPNFGTKPRNLWLELTTDGMNPFGNLSTNHSSWFILIKIYSLSPRLCMKCKYMLLSMMISGPRQSGNDIDVHLSTLIKDLRLLWEEDVEVDDAYYGEKFKMRAMLFCTINDFHAYDNLDGYNVKGHKVCPICESDTCYHQLEFREKTVYLGHRKFLKPGHSYRRLRKAFNGEQEFDIAPKPLTGDEVYQQKNCLWKERKRRMTVEKNIWNKRYVFFDLPYWSSLDVRHCLNVMHVEKNVCDSLIGTLLNIQGKTKDSTESRLDMEAMCIRKQLAPIEKGK